MVNKMKISIVMVSIIVLSIVFSSCTIDNKDVQTSPTNTPNSTAQVPSPSPVQGITVNKIDFKELDIAELEDALVNQINEFSKTGGYYFWVDDKGVFTVFIGMGARPTGGYSIKVISVEDNEGNTNIQVEETVPKADEMVTQAITYPYTIIEIKGVTDRFHVVNTSDTEYLFIDAQNSVSFITEGQYQGQIDGNSIEVKVKDSFVVFRNPEMTSIIEGLKKDEAVVISYSVSPEGQFILESIGPLESKQTVSQETEILIETEGFFQNIEWGDYLHLNMIDTDGNQVSFFVLKYPGYDVETLVEGQKIKVYWRNTDVFLEAPQAMINLDELVKLEAVE